MKHKHCGHGHRHAHRHNHGGGKKCGGTIRRVTGRLANRFGLQRHWVVIGFVICIITNPPLGLLLFLLAWFWADHPGRLEGWWKTGRESLFGTNRVAAAGNAGGAGYNTYQSEAEPESRGPRMEEVDPFFQDLKSRFEDLEKRTGGMEEQVASDEYELRREFRKMKDGE